MENTNQSLPPRTLEGLKQELEEAYRIMAQQAARIAQLEKRLKDIVSTVDAYYHSKTLRM